jgi:hypothetical protein
LLREKEVPDSQYHQVYKRKKDTSPVQAVRDEKGNSYQLKFNQEGKKDEKCQISHFVGRIDLNSVHWS